MNAKPVSLVPVKAGIASSADSPRDIGVSLNFESREIAMRKLYAKFTIDMRHSAEPASLLGLDFGYCDYSIYSIDRMYSSPQRPLQTLRINKVSQNRNCSRKNRILGSRWKSDICRTFSL